MTAWLLISAFLSLSFVIFSYLWVNPVLLSLIFQSRPGFESLNQLVNFTNHNRVWLSWIFVGIISVLTGLQVKLLNKKLLNPTKKQLILLSLPAVLFALSYNLTSNDIFTYLFSAKMVWQYGANPYVTAPSQFADQDLWVGLIHNIDFSYRYGPIYLLFSLIPMIIFSGSRFILNYLGYKLLSGSLFIAAGLLLMKSKKDWPSISLWFLNPLLLVELLANAHNEVVMISLFVLALILADTKRTWQAWIVFAASVLTKFVSIIGLPALFLKSRRREWSLKIICLVIVLFLQVTSEPVHRWYYTWLFLFLPFMQLKRSSWQLVILAGYLLTLGYWSFLQTGVWIGEGILVQFKWLVTVATIGIVLNESNMLTIFRKKSMVTTIN